MYMEIQTDMSTCADTVGHRLPVKVGWGYNGHYKSVSVCMCNVGDHQGSLWDFILCFTSSLKWKEFTERNVFELHA